MKKSVQFSSSLFSVPSFPLWLVFFFLFSACGKKEKAPGQNNDMFSWLIPQDEIFDGGPGKDGIPSIDEPNFSLASDPVFDFMGEDDLVLVFARGGEVKAYPHLILVWHEIVNDVLADLSYSVTYCPLTGTGIGWDRVLEGEVTTFGVSGLLYNTNLMPYDRKTNSTWSQQRLDCVHGELIGTRAKTYSMIEMSWGALQSIFPNALVLNTNTGYSRSYGVYPYKDYRTNNDYFLFPVSPMDSRLPSKERVLGVLSGEKVKAYSFGLRTGEWELIEDELNQTPLIVLRNSALELMVAFENPSAHSFSVLEGAFPFVLQDEEGHRYDLFGRSEDGAVDDLQMPEQFMGYWFSWGAFYPGLPLYD